MEPTTIVLAGAVISIAGLFAIPLIAFAQKIRRKKALNGDFGDLEKWKTQLRNERPVILATYESLPREDQIHVEAVAESKDEFVEQTMERVNEYLEGTEFEGLTADELSEL